jgi:hypothetical protein
VGAGLSKNININNYKSMPTQRLNSKNEENRIPKVCILSAVFSQLAAISNVFKNLQIFVSTSLSIQPMFY